MVVVAAAVMVIVVVAVVVGASPKDPASRGHIRCLEGPRNKTKTILIR